MERYVYLQEISHYIYLASSPDILKSIQHIKVEFVLERLFQIQHIMFTILLSEIPRFTSGQDIELFRLGSIVSSKEANTFATDNNSEQNLVILDHKSKISWKTTLSF